MSQSHLNELRAALTDHGWKVRTRAPDEDVRGAGTWELRRGSDDQPILIDFDGLGPMGETLPLDQSYGCQVRDVSNASLYFRRINRSRKLWKADLAAFIAALDRAADEPDLS